MIFKSTEEMFEFARSYLETHHIEWCEICTYGLWIPWIYSPCKSFFLYLEDYNIPTTIIVGNNESRDLENRIKDVSKAYSNIRIRLVENMHAKCILFSDGLFITGSMNISDSKYYEMGISTKLTKAELADVFKYITLIK